MSDKAPAWVKLPWTARLISTVFNFGFKASCRSNGLINRYFSNFFDFQGPNSSSEPINGVKTLDIIIDPSRRLGFRFYIPIREGDKDEKDGGSMPIIIYFHGGGFVWMSANSLGYDNLCRRFAKELKAFIFSVNYRLAPEHKYPCQYQDGFDVLKFIEKNSNFEGLPTKANLKQCFLAGDGAGANLAHHVAVKACDYGFQNLKIIGILSIQPLFGGVERTESEKRFVRAPFINFELTDWFWRAYLPEGSDRNHPGANVFGPKSVDIKLLNFPATIVIVGGFDPLVDWQKRYYEGLKKFGKEAYLVEYPNAFHAFYAIQLVPESAMCIKEIKNFMEKQCAK